MYNVSLNFHCHRFLHSLRSVEMTRVHPIRHWHLLPSAECFKSEFKHPLSFVSLVLKRQADYERASYCHFERAKRVEKSKSCKSDSHPRKPPYSWTTCPQTAPQSTQNINLCNKSQSAVISGLPHRSHSGSVHIYIS